MTTRGAGSSTDNATADWMNSTQEGTFCNAICVVSADGGGEE